MPNSPTPERERRDDYCDVCGGGLNLSTRPICIACEATPTEIHEATGQARSALAARVRKAATDALGGYAPIETVRAHAAMSLLGSDNPTATVYARALLAMLDECNAVNGGGNAG